MRLPELCPRRPVMTTPLTASLLLAGFLGYRQLPLAAIPVDNDQARSEYNGTR